MTERKTSPDVEAYLDRIAATERKLLERIRTIVWEEAPDAEEVIAYGIPTFKLSGNLVHYAAFKRHMSFFPGGTAHNETLKDELAGYTLSKGTIQFTPDKPLPDDLIRRIVRMRIAENREIAASRKAAKAKP
ncbi:iron chaperone [Rhizobium sp.]